MIEAIGLTKRYGTHTAVDSLSFKIEKGIVYGFLGPNGAGKSTTMNMITGCLAPSEGRVLVDGTDILEDPVAAKKKIGYLPENPPLYPDMTPEEYLNFVAKAKGIKRADRFDSVYAVMEETGITDMRNRLIKNLSKGYKQRVGIAQAMLGDPQVIILDEPTVGLDPKQISDIRDLIIRLGKTRTVILSSHILAEVNAVCDRVMIISGGKLVAFDTLENIRRDNSPENIFFITAKCKRAEAERVLNGVGGILSFELTENVDVTDSRIEAEEDISELLFGAFASEGIPLRRLNKFTPSLEEIFLSLTSDSAYIENAHETEEDDEYEDDDDEYEYEDDDDEDETGEDGDYVPLFGGR